MMTTYSHREDGGGSDSSARARELLVSCAELVHRRDIQSARRAASLLSVASSSPLGDSADRVVHQFTLALSRRLSLGPIASSAGDVADDDIAVQSSYLSLNKITPFVRFAHLTANQAILEAVEGSRRIHILDLDTSHGLQWPPLLQAIAERSGASGPPSVRITGTGPDMNVLLRTADRLTSFALSLGIPFQFHPIRFESKVFTDDFTLQLHRHPGETLAVNCVLSLNRLMRDSELYDKDGSRDVRSFLGAVRAMDPAVVTVAEREASYNSPIFLQRFMEALEHYTAVFESLEATVPPGSRERMAVEQVWLGREIADVVAGEGEGRKERSERFDRWETTMRACGFGPRPLSAFAVAQARMLLRLHYPSEGYQLQTAKDCCFLGWQRKALFSVSSWH